MEAHLAKREQRDSRLRVCAAVGLRHRLQLLVDGDGLCMGGRAADTPAG